MPPGRLHALVDGVFAIAITLLVLDLRRPEGSKHLAHDLLHSWPSYVAYLVTFATVGIVWIEHSGMMRAVQQVNRRFIERTLVLLFFVARVMALTVQDRVIRLEERLRMRALFPADLQARIDEFGVKQLVALRFASDQELPALARKVLDEKIADQKAIKKMVTSWRADDQRA